MDFAFELVQMLYWLMLSGWFGLVFFAAMATPIIFKTVQDADPTLPTVLSVNLDAQHSVLLGMTIIANVLTRLIWIQLICAGGLLAAIIGQWAFIDRNGPALLMAVVRSALYVAAAGLTIYSWRSLWPRAAAQRQAFVENADDIEAAEKHRAQLAKTQRESEIVQLAIVTLLSAMILFSANVHKAAVYIGNR